MEDLSQQNSVVAERHPRADVSQAAGDPALKYAAGDWRARVAGFTIDTDPGAANTGYQPYKGTFASEDTGGYA